ncbi:MAG TPA: carbohydrate porin [Sphingomonas sp.]
MRDGLAALLAFAAALIASPANAQEEPAVRLGASYVGDALTVIHGGLERGGAVLGRADVTLAADGAAIGLDGVRLFVDLLATLPGDFSARRVGDFQTVSNVQADSAPRPFETWVSAPIAGTASVKAGLIDLNTEFDVQRIGALFLNSAHGIGPDFSQSGANGPSIFPASAAALIVRTDGATWRTRLAVFDAIAGSASNPRRTVFRVPGARGALLVAEVEHALGGDAELQLGAWRYTNRFDPIDPRRPRAISQGAYALIEGPLGGGFDGWLRVGVADARANPIAAYVGGGIVHGPETSRLGVAVAHARLGGPARRVLLQASAARRAETAIELTWARRVADWLIVQPDLQYVINPGWDRAAKDALVAGVRMRFQFGGD